jgi:signal transduction histidine kinase
MAHGPASRKSRRRLLWGPGRKLVGVFILFILLPGAILGVIALRVLRQEVAISRQRTRETLERRAGELGRELEAEFRRCSEAVRSSASLASPFQADAFPEVLREAFAEPGGGAFLSVSGQGLEVYPAGALSYVPPSLAAARTGSDRTPARLARAESLELAQKDYPGAIRAYRGLLDSSGPGERPEILHRLARTLRKAGRLDESAAAYEELRRADPVWIGGLPSDLLARSELCSLAEERGEAVALAEQALGFFRDLSGGTWLLDKPRYLFYSDRCRSWCSSGRVAAGEFDDLLATEEKKLALSGAVEALLDSPQMVIVGDNGAYLAFWHEDPFRAAIVSTAFLGSSWWPRALSELGDDLQAVLATASGLAVMGSTPPEPPPFAVTHDLRIDDAAWLIQIWPGRPEAIFADIRQRRALSLAMLGLVAILIVFGSYATARIVRRELEIARLRADFVSTVSHEFRSPLTGIRQLSGMLLDGRVSGADKQKEYFRMIVRESDRLARLVENVLDFSRMEEGRQEYRFETLSPASWLRKVASDFAAETAVNGITLEASIPGELPTISADGQALGSAVRNLLDNAVKYSPGESTVWLEAEAEAGGIKISVRDKGVGISEPDRRRIFDRFYRAGGELSKRVKGAGLGLSLVRHVIAAHGGTVACESRVGEGSTFTIRLPAGPAGERG